MATQAKSFDEIHDPQTPSARVRANSSPLTSTVGPNILSAAGNLAMQRLLCSGVIRAKLAISQPGDACEREADQVAEQVVSGQSVPVACKEERCLQRKARPGPQTQTVSGSPLPNLDPGRPLDQGTRADMETRFGQDFGDVRVHSGAEAIVSARGVNALAYTMGHSILFGAGQYQPGTQAGRKLIAHELAHVVQQRRSGVVQLQRQSAEDVTRSSITPAYAASLNDVQLARSILDARTRLATLSPTSPEFAALRSNLAILEGEAYARFTTSMAPGGGMPGTSAARPGAAESWRPQGMAERLVVWRAASLLDPPFRPPGVDAFPPLPVTAEQASRLTPTLLAGLGLAGPIPGLSPSGPPMPPPAIPMPPVEPGPPLVRPPVFVEPPVVPIEPIPPPAVAPVAELPLWLRVGGPIAVFLTITLWPSPTAPAWMDEINQITGEPYASPQEYDWIRRLSPEQTRYLRRLEEAKRLEPDAGLETDPAPNETPDVRPTPREREREERTCQGLAIPRRGGHPRHDAYATKVSGSTSDYLVITPMLISSAYDGLTPNTVVVWEVKVGFGWFFNPAKASLTAMKLMEFDAQKSRGAYVAATCGYVYFWSIPDRWVAGLLIARWGGTPPVLSLPE